MRIGDFLYFAPGIRFSEVDLLGNTLPLQYEARITGFYLTPARELGESGYAFASGLLVVSCVDALSRLIYNRSGVGKRFQKWLVKELQSFSDEQVARRFYLDFRNGLVHEGRVKNGGEFSLQQETTVLFEYSIMRVNPLCLLEEVDKSLSRFVKLLVENDSERNSFIGVLKHEFEYELAGVES
jgi:hypothetical protein